MKKPPSLRKIFNRNDLEAYTFIFPFILGLAFFFIFPLVMSFKLSLGTVESATGLNVDWLPLDKLFTHYIRAFLVDTSFVPHLINILRVSFLRVPLVVIFALLIAVAISRKIRMRGFFRTAFFFPFLLGAGLVLEQMLYLNVDRQALTLENSLIIPPEVLAYLSSDILSAVNTFFQMIVFVLWNNGVQILLFMSGIQSISPSLYESANVDGATQWEMFWKITLPMMKPIILLNIIYSIADSYTNVTNAMMKFIHQTAFVRQEMEYGAALGWIYVAVTMSLVGIAFVALSERNVKERRSR